MADATRSWELKGMPKRLLTRAQVSEKGMALSRAKAQRTREVESWEATTQGPRAIKRMKVRPKAPPTDWVTWRNSSVRGSPVFVSDRAAKSCTLNIRAIR